MVSNGNVNIYIERVLVDKGEHKSKVSTVLFSQSSQHGSFLCDNQYKG